MCYPLYLLKDLVRRVNIAKKPGAGKLILPNFNNVVPNMRSISKFSLHKSKSGLPAGNGLQVNIQPFFVPMPNFVKSLDKIFIIIILQLPGITGSMIFG